MRIQKKQIKALLFLSILIFIGIFLWNTDFQAVWKELHNIGYRFLYLMGITYLAYLIGTWSWHVCLGSDRDKISVFRLFSLRQVGETVGQYNPTSIVGGDMLKVELLKPYGIGTSNAANSVATSRITAVLSQILLFLIACIWLLASPSGEFIMDKFGALFYGLVTVLALAKITLFFWLGRKTKQARPAKPTEGQSFWRRLSLRIQGLLWDIRTFYQNHSRIFWYSYLLAALHWVVGSMEFYLILRFLGYDVRPMHGLLLDMSVIVFKSLGAFIPGQLGIEELGNKMMLAAIGISTASLWITVSILRRARQLCWIAIGFILYLFIKKSDYVSSHEMGSLIRKS